LPNGATINVVREEPKRKGLLFAGSETQVWVSFDDGDHWASLRLNMPATSIRDLVIKDDDIAVGTHGRSFWILDGLAPLRQLTAATERSEATLFKPGAAYRFRWSKYTDTPLPPDEPYGQNPPDGAIIDYYLGANIRGDATLEIRDASGRVIRTYSSRDTSMAPADLGNVPAYWIRPTQVLSAAPGFHRFVWDMHYAPPAGTSTQPGQYPISGTPHDTPREPRGPRAAPGEHSVRLIVGGKTYVQTFNIKMDPRVKTPATVIAQSHLTAVALFDAIARDSAIVARADAARNQLREARGRSSDLLGGAIDAFDAALVALVGQGAGGARGGGRGRGGGAPGAQTTFRSIDGELLTLLALLEQSDGEPTTQAMTAVRNAQRDFASLTARWARLRTTDLVALNAKLRAAGQQPIVLEP